jgi:hypothetical protein
LTLLVTQRKYFFYLLVNIQPQTVIPLNRMAKTPSKRVLDSIALQRIRF